MPLGAGAHARYPLGVDERTVDRAAWAAVLTDLINTETRGKKATFAKKVNVDPRTVARWLDQDNDVSEASVRSVARHLGRSPVELLVKAGFYTEDDFGQAAVLAEVADEEEQRILALDIAEEVKVALIERLREMQEADRVRRQQLIDMMAQQLKGS